MWVERNNYMKNTKLFFVTIPMLPNDKLKLIPYRKEDRGEILSEPSRFPGIVMLENCILENEPVRIVTIRTNDDNKCTESNYALFKEELAALSIRLERKQALEIDKEIFVEHSENREKQIRLFKSICECYREDDDVYMDITYGTKVTTSCMFSTLTYAERIAKSNIKGVYYGKFPFGDATTGDLYNVRCMYELAMLANAVDFTTKKNFDELLNKLWRYHDNEETK